MNNPENSYPNILEYELTFKVRGLSFLFCDLLMSGFEYLEPLFTSSQSEFRQYFPNKKMEWAANEGYAWLSKKDGFDNYQKEFEKLNQHAKIKIGEILSTKKVTEESVKAFFEIFAKYLNYYSKTDFAFTNKVYQNAENDPIIRTNLVKLVAFKDIARVWVNGTAIDENSFFSRMVTKIAKELGLEEKIIENYKAEEVLALFSGSKVQSELINGRSASYIIYIKAGKRYYLTGDEAVKFIKKAKDIEEKITENNVHGQIANKTAETVEGIVRIINVDYGNISKMNEEIREMKKGEILVAEFTAPELICACRKAKAIITDLGGMLSHAAIVSRELGIPCIVGTQIATKALKNGDQISIDLNTGKLRRKNRNV